MQKIRKGDEIVVTAGKDKGKRGVVLQVLEEGRRLLVEGINAARKHVKPNPQANEKGGVVLKLLPIQRSNVMLYDAASGKGSRVGIRRLEDGRLARFFKSTGELVDAS